jgi:predicted RNase H-like HicB family nuclease
MKIELEREDDGRWIAEIPDLPGVMVYGNKRADRLEHGEQIPELCEVFAISA